MSDDDNLEPENTRFEKERNRKGRPKGSENRKTILRRVISETQTVSENGKLVQKTILELLIHQLRRTALENKNTRTAKEYLRFLKIYAPERDPSNCGVMIAPAEVTPEEWAAEMEERNKHAKPPPGYGDSWED